MRTVKIFVTLVLLGIGAITTQAFIINNNKKAIQSDATDKGFAVVELFTSEGCSSCPSADALVARVQKESNGKPVYILAFHVDYWNRLGWKDVFSSAAFSERQNDYANWLNLSSVYTPQIVVNGRTEFVGSQEGNLRNAIRSGLQTPAKSELVFNSIKVDNDKATIQYHTERTSNNNTLLLALVEKNATTKVQRGENSGRTLSHVQIVTQLKSVALRNGNSGSESIALPHNFDPQKWEVIGFIQNPTNGEITGASKGEFSSVTNAMVK